MGSAIQLPHEILLYISAISGGPSMLRQLMLHRPFYEYYVANRQYCIQLHTLISVHVYAIRVKSVFNKLHSEDGPAVIRADCTQIWYHNNKKHREDGPAVIYADGAQYWYRNGELYREDGPVVIYANSTFFEIKLNPFNSQ